MGMKTALGFRSNCIYFTVVLCTLSVTPKKKNKAFQDGYAAFWNKTLHC